MPSTSRALPQPSGSSPSRILSPCTGMEYTLADLDAIYRDGESLQLPAADESALQQTEMGQLFDFGDIKDDMILNQLNEDDQDSSSSGHLVIDQLAMPPDSEPEDNSE